jgi:hypothetical protein
LSKEIECSSHSATTSEAIVSYTGDSLEAAFFVYAICGVVK